MSRKLEENKLTVHNKKGHCQITINKVLTKKLYDAGYKCVSLDYSIGSEGKRLYLNFFKEEKSYGAKIHYTIGSDDKKMYCSMICSKVIVKQICETHKLDRGSFVFACAEGYRDDHSIFIWPFEQIGKMCTKCGKVKPMSQFYKKGEKGLQSHCKDCMKAHGRLRNGSTGVYREEPKEEIKDLFEQKENILLKYTATELINHLRMRGELDPEFLWSEMEKQGCYIEDNKIKQKTVRVINV